MSFLSSISYDKLFILPVVGDIVNRAVRPQEKFILFIFKNNLKLWIFCGTPVIEADPVFSFHFLLFFPVKPLCSIVQFEDLSRQKRDKRLHFIKGSITGL